ncbi:hypothetical protein GCM10009847_00070 [Leucobacter tardus]|uniref:hypothetical protein n=1 Tax=Leucobacter tardus TaxID=501483 RepID=UPI001FB880AA|nr:hypothetical protein [Leucobacter tardus]
MNHQSQLDDELERRLIELESVEAADPVHAALGGRSLGWFLGVVLGITAIAWIGSAL